MSELNEPERNHLLDPILESISDGVFTVDADWRITSFNRAAENMTGVPRQEAIGSRCCDVFHSNMCEAACALKETMGNGEPIISRSGYIVDAAGKRIPISVSTALLRDSNGTITGGAETFRDLSAEEGLRKQLSKQQQLGDLVSHSPTMLDLFELAEVVARSPSTILIQGETGTGKELLARAIHQSSERSTGPFVAINCGAIPDNLLESELFGHVKGAFTGAHTDRSGRFAAAKGGTLFLDEIGEVSAPLQVRLLRVLQERTYEPLGTDQSEQADVRVIAATHRNLSTMVSEGEFRADLYYRINVVLLEIPPLRERREDIPLLTDHFIERFNHRFNRTIRGISHDALVALMAHDWPGNVRELENAIERAFVVCTRTTLQAKDLPQEFVHEHPVLPTTPRMASARHAAERLAIEHALRESNNNRTAAAHSLGIHKTTLYRRMHALGLPVQAGRERPKRHEP